MGVENLAKKMELNMPYTDDQLRFASKHFIFHIKIYVETLLLLLNPENKADHWDTNRIAIMEDHLVHARILINFVCKNTRDQNTDVIAKDYFYDVPSGFEPLNNNFLTKQAIDIGGQLVHLTIKGMPLLKSQWEWPISEIKDNLVPALKMFLSAVPKNRFEDGYISSCNDQLARSSIYTMPVSTSSAT